MSNTTEFFRWWTMDELTGKRRLTTYKLTRADAARAFPGAEPDLETREVRDLLVPDSRSNTRPGQPWVDRTPVDPRANTQPSG